MNKSILTAAALAIALAQGAHAQQITVVNFGGANGDAQKKAFYGPFEQAEKTKVVPVEFNGEQARIKAMVEAKNVTWDVVEVESPDVTRGCEEGLYEKIDWSKVGNKADFEPAAVTDCGVGIFVWSTVMAYNGDKITNRPTSWADFWDTKKYPGKRGMRKGARYNLEFALMADGVKPADVYKVLETPAGADRAFRKLGELKPSIQWWEAGAQPPQMLLSGDVSMSTAYNGRIAAAQHEGKFLQIAWYGGIYDLDYWAIPRGDKNQAAAYKFIKFASTGEAQSRYASEISYGPTNTKALALLHPKTLQNLPTAPRNAKDAVQFDVKFWSDRGEELEKRFSTWVAQ